MKTLIVRYDVSALKEAEFFKLQEELMDLATPQVPGRFSPGRSALLMAFGGSDLALSDHVDEQPHCEALPALPSDLASDRVDATGRGDATASPRTLEGPDRPPCRNDDCDRCHPLPRWRVSTTTVERRKHEREFKAAAPEGALQQYAVPTAWPSDYDTRTVEVVEVGAPVVAPVTDAFHLEHCREHRCFHDFLEGV